MKKKNFVFHHKINFKFLLCVDLQEIEAQNLLGCNVMFLVGCRPTFQRCVPPLSGPDDGGSTYLWNVGGHPIKNTAVHPRRFWASYSPAWELEISLQEIVWLNLKPISCNWFPLCMSRERATSVSSHGTSTVVLKLLISVGTRTPPILTHDSALLTAGHTLWSVHACA
jgi:hypothetical protein